MPSDWQRKGDFMALSFGTCTINTAGTQFTAPILNTLGTPAIGLNFPGGAGTSTGLFLRWTHDGYVQQGNVPDGTYTISGSNLIIPIGATIPSDATTVQILAFGCNVQDTLATTFPGGVTTANVTNASTSAVNSALSPSTTNSAVNGTYADYAANGLSAGAPACRLFQPISGETITEDFILTISTATSYVNLLLWTTTNIVSFKVNIDNAGDTTFTTQLNNNGKTIGIATALGVGAHTFRITYASGAPWYFTTAPMLQIFGGTGVLTQPHSDSTNAPSSWSVYPTTGTGYEQQAFTDGTKTVNTKITLEGGASTSGINQAWKLSTGNIFPLTNISGPSGSIHTPAKPSDILLYCNDNAALYDLRVDNISVGQVATTGSTNNLKFLSFASLLSGVAAGAHDYYIVNLCSPTAPSYMCNMIIAGTSLGTPPAARPLWAFIGDSRVANVGVNGQFGTTFGPIHGFPYLVANKAADGISLGVAFLNLGISASTWKYFGGSGETPNPTLSTEFQVVNNNAIVGNNQGYVEVVAYAGINDARNIQGARPHTTTSAAITSTGSQSVQVASTTGFVNGQSCWIDIGGADPDNSPGVNCENVVVTVVDGTHLSANLTKTHASGAVIGAPETSLQMQIAFFNVCNTCLGVVGLKMVILGTGPTNVNGNEALYGETATGANQVIGYSNLVYVNSRLIAALAPSGAGNGNGSGTFLTAPQIANTTYIDPNTLQLNLAAGSYDVTNNGTPPPTPLTPPQSNYFVNYFDKIHENGAGNLIIANGILAALLSPATAYTQSLSASSGYTDNPVTITYAGNGSTTELVTPNPTPGVSGSYSPATVNLNGITNVTQTFTPTTAGTASLVPTNGGGLINPGANTYTVSLASVTSTIAAVTWNLVGVGTLWTGTPFTLVSGGGSITAQSVSDNTHASITITGGTSPWVVSDGSRQFTLKASASGGGGIGSGQTFVITGVLNI